MPLLAKTDRASAPEHGRGRRGTDHGAPDHVVRSYLDSCASGPRPRHRRSLMPAALHPVHEVYAVHFASIRYSVGQLVAGGDRARPIDIAMMVWPVKLAGGRDLVDAGFYREKFLQQWKPRDYVRPTDALAPGSASRRRASPTSSSPTSIGITPTAPTCFRARGSGSSVRNSSTTSARTARSSIGRSTATSRRCFST